MPGLLSAWETPAEPIHLPLVAAWSMDDADDAVCRDSSGNGNDLPLAGQPTNAIHRVPGLWGRALAFSGQHQLSLPGRPDLSSLRRIAFAAWVKPARFDGYNEIFRKEDGDHRVLFSFQEHGTILSLGLNIGGYVECDAPIDPGDLLDGQWHHVSATFDGTWMRVYLDGGEIGRLNRPGTLSAGGPAAGCVGSVNGGECFQGSLDDLRLYGEALDAGQIRSICQTAQAALDRWNHALAERLAAIYHPAPSFSETLAGTRRSLRQTGQPLAPDLAAAVNARLKQTFPQPYADFVRWTALKPLEVFQTTNAGWVVAQADRLWTLLLEYRPLTEHQWERLTPAQRAHWAEIEALGDQVASLKARGDDALDSPEWIELLVALGRRVEYRPYRQEAVAPYVPPATPPTRDRTATEAQAAIQQDWLHQADQAPTPDRIRQEIQWARELAERLRVGHPLTLDLSAELADLARCEAKVRTLSGPDAALYFDVRAAKRRIAFRNPAIDFARVLLVDMPLPQGSEWQHETRHRLGYMAVPGARLLVLDGLAPDGHLTQLMPQAPLHGSFWRPDLSYDARRVLFCFKPHNEKAFHLYEIGIDGQGLRQLTDGPFDDLDPIYLPDDDALVFSTTRGNTYVRCMPPTSAFVLARLNRANGRIYLISANNEPDYLPSVTHDGRILYTRWEYTDKPLWRAQKLWTVHPDGTRVNTLWGNQSVWPDLLKDARCIPGSRRILFTGSAHHDWFSGSLGILTPGLGYNFPDGLAKITAELPWPECGNGPVDPIESPRYHPSGRYVAYYSPYPLTEQDFLVSANRNGKFALYLMDVDGNRELIYEGTHHVLHALPLRARPKPPILPDHVDWVALDSGGAPAQGTLFSGNVYQGAPAELRGRARFLRVLTIDHKTYTYWHQRPYISTGPVVSGVQSDGVKRILGTVPIAADGSVAFNAPAGIPLHFQLLDEEERALQTMRSFANLMPGESRGCLGCHELHSTTPDHRFAAQTLTRDPVAITPPPWDDTSVSYPRYVRPVLDHYCARCHTGDGEGRSTLDFTERPGFLGFDETYWLLIGRPSWGQPYQPPSPPPPGWGIADTLMVEAYSTVDPNGYRTPPPMTALSYRSRLIQLAASGQHHDVKVDRVNLLRLTVWIDTICPYQGDEEIRSIPDPDFQGVEWLAVRPRIRTAPHIQRPGPLN